MNAKVQCINAHDKSKPISPSDGATDITGKLDLIEKFSGIADFATTMPDDVKRYTITFSCNKAKYTQSKVSVYVHPIFTCNVVGSKCT